MKTLFEACTPRKDVLTGELREDIFAARLRDVMEGSAEDVYGDAPVYFANTYPTDGLKELLKESLGRLTGKRPDASSVIRLETSFGGGKTHNLIGLYHSAKADAPEEEMERLGLKGLAPTTPIGLIAGVVGTELEPAAGLTHPDGTTTYTLAGAIAHQLRGAEGYEIVRENDEAKVATGESLFDRLIGDESCLIMLDEMGRHMRVASAVSCPGNPGMNVAEQEVATLMSLLEFASSKANVSVVLTLADSQDAFGKETDELREQLAEAQKVSARKERVLEPSNEEEMPAIVTHRLFESVDEQAREEVTAAYTNFYESLKDRSGDFPVPDSVHGGDYRNELKQVFPFHPSFLRTLQRKTSTIPSFQQTRGALRLLARTVRALWENKPADTYLIHIEHLDLGIGDIVNDLTSRLDRPAFSQVVHADLRGDLQGSGSHADKLDEARLAEGKRPLAYQLGTTIFLHSLTQGVASGIKPEELAEATLQPGDEPGVHAKVLRELEDQCWFLDYDGHHYRFKTEPSLNKLIADEVQAIPRTRAKRDLEERIRSVWKPGVFKPDYFPSEPSEVEDDGKNARLVVVHFDAATAGESGPEGTVPDLVSRLSEHAGSMQGYRTYRNHVLFLVADEDQTDRMVHAASRRLAIDRLVHDSDRMQEFNQEQKSKLRDALKASELELRVSITRAYRFLYYPSGDAPADSSGLARHILPPQDQGTVSRNQADVLIQTLKALDKVWDADGDTKAPAWIRSKALPHGWSEVTTQDLRREFGKRLALPLLLDPAPLKKSIKLGVQNGAWVYYSASSGTGYGQGSPPPLIELSEDAVLFTPDEAKARGITISGTEPEPSGDEACPVCHHDPCTCLDEPDDGGPQAVQAEGAPREALQKVADAFTEQGITHLKTLFLTLEGRNKEGATEQKALGMAIPQLGKVDAHVEQDLTLEFEGAGSLKMDFRADWDRYRRLKEVTDAFAADAEQLTTRTRLRLDYKDGLEVGGDQFQRMADVMAKLPFGRVQLHAEPVAQDPAPQPSEETTA